MAIVQRNAGTFVGSSFLVAPSSGSFGVGTTLIIGVFGNTIINTPSGFTLRASSVNTMGIYAYDKTGAGESSISVTASAGQGTWVVWELSFGSTWLTGSATEVGGGTTSFTTPSITPASGNAHLLAMAGANSAGISRTVTAWSNGFTEFADLQAALTGDGTFAAAADVDVLANGATSYSTTATFSSACSPHGGFTLAYVNASTGPAFVAAPPLVVGQAVNRSYTY